MNTKEKIKTTKKWIKALRSGDYRQGRQTLCQFTTKGNALYCCLGVLCEVENGPQAWQNELNHEGYPTRLLVHDDRTDLYYGKNRWLEKYVDPFVLAELNDNGASFKNIARHLEETLLAELQEKLEGMDDE